MKKIIRIGTRNSPLALWQANVVKTQLEQLGYLTTLVPITSNGDLVLDKPLYEMGITGVFTKTLDIAMLNGQIDIAIHSMKDVPTLLPKGIVQTAVLERGSYTDVFVPRGNSHLDTPCTIATGSLRRKAQWLHRYPHHNVVGLRGNVNTRLQRLADSDWQGAIFAKAGLERVELLPKDHWEIDWMVPAPAQGAMMVVALVNDLYCKEATEKLNHKPSDICTHVERDFLRVLEGGCTAPIGALSKIIGEEIHFHGILLSVDGEEKIDIKETTPIANVQDFGSQCAQNILANGGKALMERIKKDLAS